MNDILNKPLSESPDNLKWLELEIRRWLESKERKLQLDGERYYKGDQDILKAKRMAIGRDGKKIEVNNVPNKKIVDNQYKRLVKQKVNHLVGKPLTINATNEKYQTSLEPYFNKKFMKLLNSVATDSNNGGISYLYPYYENNELKFKRFKSHEVKVYWKDIDHTEIDFFIHWYEDNVWLPNGNNKKIEHVEVYTLNGVTYYLRDEKGNLLYDNDKQFSNYLTRTELDSDNNVITNESYNFERIPLIPFKLSDDEQPLLKRVKTIQDAINTILSTFTNNMLEDSRNTILILVNYDGQNLGEFRENLATYGVVKVRSDSSGGGDVKSLQVEVNSENYKAILEIFKNAIIENGGGVDVKNLNSGTPNQMNIQSAYYDLEQDTNGTEIEFQASIEELLWFINFDLNYKGIGNFYNEEVDVIFNRDMLQDETSIIDNLMKLKGTIADEDIIRMLPFGDASKLIENMEKQKQKEKEELNDYVFPKVKTKPLSNKNELGDM